VSDDDRFPRIGPSPERLQYLDALTEIERLRVALEQTIGLLDQLDNQARDGGGKRHEIYLTIETWNEVFIPLRQKARAALAAKLREV
jgi:hypothetical protein